MKLHRVGRRPDWVRISRRRWNAWQRLAGNTGGLATLGNLFTLIGLIVVLAGLVLIADGKYWHGLMLLAAGRACDLLDGWLADRTGTKSPLGEALDATADKLETLAAVIVLTIMGILPAWVALAIVLSHTLITLVAFIARQRHARLHPSLIGKLAMAAAWVGLLLFLLASATGMATGIWSVLAYAVCGLSVIMALAVAGHYSRQTITSK